MIRCRGIPAAPTTVIQLDSPALVHKSLELHFLPKFMASALSRGWITAAGLIRDCIILHLIPAFWQQWGEHCCFTGTLHCSSALCQGLNCLWNQGTVSLKLQANNQLQMTRCINNKHGDTQKPALLLLHSPKLPGWWLTTACAPASADAIWIYWCFLDILLECDSQLLPKMRNVDIHWWHKVTSTLIKYFSQEPCSCIHSHPSLSSWAVTCSPRHSWQEGLWNAVEQALCHFPQRWVSPLSWQPGLCLLQGNITPKPPGTQGLIPEGYRSLSPS